MANADVILELIRRQPGLTDSEIVQRTGIVPHQQVNRLCRRLFSRGQIQRICDPRGRLINVPVDGSRASDRGGIHRPEREVAPSSHVQNRYQQRAVASLQQIATLDPHRTLFILSCSRKKEPYGEPNLVGPSIAEHVADPTARALKAARDAIRREANLNDSQLLPAWRRYQGSLYQALATDLGRRIEESMHVLILSGGYGVVLAEEPIGTYNLRFRRSRWPHGLIEACLTDYARKHKLSAMLGFLGRRTPYADVVRQTHWRDAGVTSAYLVAPDSENRRGAQRLVPRAQGESIGAFWRQELGYDWLSSDGWRVLVEELNAV